MRLLVLLLGLLWGLVHGACPRGVYNNKICSGHGRCNPHNLCVCDVNHSGFDCSQHRCPLGPAWVAPARAPDDAHYPVECSNKGVCDRETGACTCDEGFVGSACQRLACRDNCDDAGDCLSLKHLSAVYAVGSEPLYDNVWDADMIYGCKCRKGYHGYDCTMRSCPRGDDPLTTGQKNEVQIIQCTATGGFFYLFFNGEGAQVPFDVTVSQLSTILASVRTLPQVKITFAGATTTVCSNTAPVPVLIEFTYAFGPQPAIKVLGALKNVVSLTGGVVLAASGGVCPAGPSWYTAPSASNTVHDQWAECSNMGHCDRVTGECSCYTPFEGVACEFMKCSGESACSGHGQCMSIRQLSLEADVDSPSLQFDYGADPNNVLTFDRDSILGCKCDPEYEGYDCSQRSCPKGDDPVTTDQVDEIQVLQCTGTGGHFRLQYRTSTSARIPFDATATTLRNILVFSFGFDDPVVQYSSGTQACSPPTASVPNIITISFLLDHGDIPPLAAITRSLTVSGGIGTVATADNGVAIGGVTSQQGTKENVVCSNRGHCNYQQGTCTCSFGFGSSDGRGNRGNRGDCGYILPKVKYLLQE
ncbi:hypothetical protein PHYBOEH_006167 [Phytophthora boehmeriae]|uniref:EGF-like domain-containing protein n=1 Tax=Phytophthora boehmeriae TaxID=109152 RepID=A0A8T1WN98_9STRA|nr:hypothetical protein PHYBOEH_006167 [Phytophthora boehmeriae]